MSNMKTSKTRQEISVPGLLPAISHFVDAVRFGDMLFISGITGHDANGDISDSVVEQTRQTLTNIGLVLKATGASFADILKVTVYLTDVNDRAAINPVRKEFFGAAKPASTLIQVAALALPGMKVEIEAVVGLPNQG